MEDADEDMDAEEIESQRPLSEALSDSSSEQAPDDEDCVLPHTDVAGERHVAGATVVEGKMRALSKEVKKKMAK